MVSPLIDLARDLRFAARALRRRIAFTATVVATLALGIGANTVIFTVVDRTLLRPLAYANAGALVAVLHHDVQRASNDKAAGAEVVEWRARKAVFSDVGFAWDAQFTLTSTSRPLALRAFQFSTNFFSILGVPPTIGRTFVPADDEPGADHVVVLSDHLWRNAFAASPNIVGRVVRLDDQPYTVIGVMPERFAHPDAAIDLWTPLALPLGLVNDSALRAFNVVGRLRPNVTADAARRALSSAVALQSLRDVYLGPARPMLWILQGAVCLLLLMATANVANLVLAHATSVQHEVALRLALGSSRGRLVRQFVAQGLVLSTAGGVAGVMLASFAVSLLPVIFRQLLAVMPRDLGDGVSWAAVATAAVIALAVGLLIGSLMAFSSHAVSTDTLRRDTRGGTARHDDTRLRGAIIALQIAVSLLLLASSGLLIKSYLKLERRSLGFDPARRLTFVLQPHPGKYAGLARTSIYLDQVLARIRALPGVTSAAATSAIPVTGMDARRRLVLPGAHDSAGENVAHYRVVSPDYFATMGIPLLRGRRFTNGDRSGAPDVALVNETLARARWSGEDPVGKIVTIAGGPALSTVQIVGVIGDVRHEGLAADPQSEVYRPADQAFWPFFGIVLRTDAGAGAMTKPIEEAVWSIDRSQPIDGVQSLERIAAESVALRRTSMLLLVAFAIAAALLAAVGIYGVISYVVSMRTREIGIRVALGASPRDVMRRVVGSGARLALVGATLGIVATLVLTRYLASLLFGVPPRDASTISAAFVVTIAIALAASYMPARRAARIDPAITLRSD